MIDGREIAAISHDPTVCTLKSAQYIVKLEDGPKVRLWDTAGLDEDLQGSSSDSSDSSDSIIGMEDLIRSLGQNGVSLLIYCVRGRIKNTTVRNYELLKTFCTGKVRIGVVVTGLELVGDREAWWAENRKSFRRAGMIFDGYTCVVSTRGPKIGDDYVYDKAYKESAIAVRAMIIGNLLSTPFPRDADSTIRFIWRFCQRHNQLKITGFVKAASGGAEVKESLLKRSLKKLVFRTQKNRSDHLQSSAEGNHDKDVSEVSSLPAERDL